MGSGLSEAALAIFTTLVPIGAGAFITLAFASFFCKYDEETSHRVDKMTVIPLAVAVVGFIAVFFHVGQPLKAVGIFAGVGSSPLSNEVLVGVVFMTVAIMYWILAMAGKLSANARKIFLVITALVALVFCWFVGSAYAVETIPTWNTPLASVEIVAFALVGGPTLAFLTLTCAKADISKEFGIGMLCLAIFGLVCGLVALVMHAMLIGGLSNAYGPAVELVPAFGALTAVFAFCSLAALACCGYAIAKKSSTASSAALYGVAFILICIGVFFARIAFYGIHLTAGL